MMGAAALLVRYGLLDQELANRATLAREAHLETMGEALTPLLESPDPNLLEQQARINRATSASWESALALALEFPSEERGEA